MVAEHGKRFPNSDLGATFAMQTQGNAIVAVIAGLVAQASVEVGGYGAPFAVALPLLACCAVQVRRWPENLGSSHHDIRAVVASVWSSLSSVVVRVGLIQCLFESAMHVFVFLWTPCLQRGGGRLPHGVIFSLYMVCVMAGSQLLSPRCVCRPSLGAVCIGGACCLLVPSATENIWCNLTAFCCFEVCVGCYFPQIAMLRSRHLQEKSRSATITLFRVPLNCIVVAVLIWGRALAPGTVLVCASAALAVGAAAFYSLPKWTVPNGLAGAKES